MPLVPVLLRVLHRLLEVVEVSLVVWVELEEWAFQSFKDPTFPRAWDWEHPAQLAVALVPVVVVWDSASISRPCCILRPARL
jgi:hypothetical protein